MAADKRDDGPGKPDDGLSETARGMQQAQPWIDAVWQLLGGFAVGVIGGLLLDRYAGTRPWGLVGFSVVGIGVGFWAFIRASLRMGKKR